MLLHHASCLCLCIALVWDTMVVRHDFCFLCYLNVMCFGSYYLCFRVSYSDVLMSPVFISCRFSLTYLDAGYWTWLIQACLIPLLLLYHAYWNQVIWKPQLFSYSRLLSSITKKGEIERASRPLVISVINDNVDYYDYRVFCRGKVIVTVMVIGTRWAGTYMPT